MAKKPPSIADQVRAALDGIFGRKRRAPRRKGRKPAIRVAPRKNRPPTYTKRPPKRAKVYVPPSRGGQPKTCSVCGKAGHNARRHRSLDPAPSVNQIGVCKPDPGLSPGAPPESDLGPVLEEPPLPDEAHVVAEIPSAPPAPPDPPAAPAEGDPAGREVEAAGSVPEDVEGGRLAPAAEAELPPEI